MKIWVTRHGQTDLNLKKRMQGRSNVPLNETGRAQARAAAEQLKKIRFDAVYASPLDRAVETAALLSGWPQGSIRTEPRIIETDFGSYEARNYFCLGPAMTLYWALPELFPAPKTVETVESMKARSHAFLKELEAENYENVLIVCHGGIIRAICGYLEDRENGIKWRPKPHNCEIRVYESDGQGHHKICSLPEMTENAEGKT